VSTSDAIKPLAVSKLHAELMPTVYALQDSGLEDDACTVETANEIVRASWLSPLLLSRETLLGLIPRISPAVFEIEI